MNSQEAARLINENVSYKAGWRVRAFAFEDDHTRVYLGLRAVVQDSDRRHAPNYPYPIRTSSESFVDVSPTTTEQDLYKSVLDFLINQEIHEAREFFKVGRDYYAPFHPHTSDGEDRYKGVQVPLPRRNVGSEYARSA